MLRQAFMAATILVLLLLVLITPRLTGIQEDISSLPRLILNYEEDELIVFVTSLSGTYLYRSLFLNITPVGEVNATVDLSAKNSHSLEKSVNLNETGTFVLEAVAVDRRSTQYDISVEVTADRREDSWLLGFLFPEDSQPRMVRAEDLFSSPLATLMQRRDDG